MERFGPQKRPNPFVPDLGTKCSGRKYCQRHEEGQYVVQSQLSVKNPAGPDPQDAQDTGWSGVTPDPRNRIGPWAPFSSADINCVQ